MTVNPRGNWLIAIHRYLLTSVLAELISLPLHTLGLVCQAKASVIFNRR